MPLCTERGSNQRQTHAANKLARMTGSFVAQLCVILSVKASKQTLDDTGEHQCTKSRNPRSDVGPESPPREIGRQYFNSNLRGAYTEVGVDHRRSGGTQ